MVCFRNGQIYARCAEGIKAASQRGKFGSTVFNTSNDKAEINGGDMRSQKPLLDLFFCLTLVMTSAVEATY
jgi:hypothetical protein